MAGAVVATSVSCKKGDTGPKGDKGDKGEMGLQGPQGVPGKDGKDGKDGFAGVKKMDFTLTLSNTSNEKTKDLSSIMNSNNDVVLMYLIDEDDDVFPLPIEDYWYGGNDYGYGHGYYMSGKTIHVYLSWSSSFQQSIYFNPYSTTDNYRAVVIPISAIQANPDVDLNDYSAVQKAFAID